MFSVVLGLLVASISVVYAGKGGKSGKSGMGGGMGGGMDYCDTAYYSADELQVVSFDGSGDNKLQAPLYDYSTGEKVGMAHAWSEQYLMTDGKACYKDDFTFYYEPLLERNQLNTVSFTVPSCVPTANPPHWPSWFTSEVRAYAGTGYFVNKAVAVDLTIDDDLNRVFSLSCS